MGDDISLGQCVCIIRVRLGMPVPYVVISGIGAISSVDVAFPSCSSLSLSSCCTLFRDSSNILSEYPCLAKYSCMSVVCLMKSSSLVHIHFNLSVWL